MVRLPRPVTTRTSCRPAWTASSTTYWMAGLSRTGSISLGWAFVAGRNRVPNPAAGITALLTFIPPSWVPNASCRSERRQPTAMPDARRRGRCAGAYHAAPMGSPGTDLAAEKAALRVRMRAARAALSTEERTAAAAAVEAALFELPELAGAGTVLAFASFGSEI